MNMPAIERPIIFTAQEVNAVLAGDKTQYRVPALTSEQVAKGYKYCYGVASGQVVFTKEEDGGFSFTDGDYVTANCPFGAIGDRLWVQEDHARQSRWEQKFILTGAHYFADGPLTLDIRHDAGLLERHLANDMPRWASRILLEITDIRIERVRDTKEYEAKAEGFKPTHTGISHQFSDALGMYTLPHRASFIDAWDHKNGAGSYKANPWVWVIEFKVVEPSEVTK